MYYETRGQKRHADRTGSSRVVPIHRNRCLHLYLVVQQYISINSTVSQAINKGYGLKDRSLNQARPRCYLPAYADSFLTKKNLIYNP